MRISSLSIGSTVFVVLLSLLSCVSMVRADDPRPSISVSGSARVMVTPDLAVINASVSSRFATLDEAVAHNQKSIEQAIGYLKEMQIDPKHIQASQITIQPIWPERDDRNHPPVAAEDLFKMSQPIGYQASREFQITLVDLNKFEQIYSGMIKNGVNVVNSVSFTTSELRQHRDAARIQAVRAAREKATAMAKELDAKLLSVKSIAEAAEHRGVSYMQNAVFVAPQADGFEGVLAPGQIEVTASVDVEFYLRGESLDD
ncbi:MAG: SIMPL domain-containing protein [Planctomycetaceae bacterium]|nr:SIMPL domain-containing protein [Planctomycetaceae bacterium]